MPPLAVLAAGGTGGHMFPAQALAEELLHRGWRVALASDARGLRYAGGFPAAVERREVHAGGLRAPHRIARGVLETWRRFGRDQPAVVIGFGGYPALPSLVAARFRFIPTMIHEQNGVLGRVNRRFAPHVQAVALGVPLRDPGRGRFVQVGNPVREAVLARAGAPRGGGDAFNLLVFGGSQGARVLAYAVPRALAGLTAAQRAGLCVVIQARPEDEASVRQAMTETGVRAEIAPFFDDMPQRIAAADLVIARAGASTVAELGVIGRAAILAPYPHATDDHQTANARALSDAGAAIVLTDAQMTGDTLTRTLTDLLNAPERLDAMAAAALKTGRPDAARALADLLEEVAAQRPPQRKEPPHDRPAA